MEKVAPIFGLDPAQPLWLVRKNGNIAVFPKGNRFTGPLIASGWAYEVKQQEAGSSSPGPSSRLPQAGSNSTTPYPVPPPSTSAFGAYTGPTYSQPVLTPIPASRSKKTWRKTIILVSLTRKEGVRASKGNARVDYEVVTQVVVNLSSSACTVSAVTDLVRKQVDFDVILLDSKCYPLLGNDSTSGEGFWKSTRKVLATSRELYKKLTGQTTDPGRASIDLMRDDSSDNSDVSFPSSKRARLDCKSQEDIHHKLDEIARGVSSVQKLVTFMSNMKQAFECVVCKGIVSTPTMAQCCGRIVGCEGCVDSWLQNHATCPHCSSVMSGKFPVRGLDEVLVCLRANVEGEQLLVPNRPSKRLTGASDSQSDSDFDDLPSFRIPHPQD